MVKQLGRCRKERFAGVRNRRNRLLAAVFSLGVAGAMVASNGAKNLNTATLKNIALAWVLTLPAAMALSGVLYFIFSRFV